MKSSNGFVGVVIAVFMALVILLLPFGLVAWYVYGTQQTRELEVVKSERVQDGGDSKYLVFAKEGVFQNTDSFLRWKFNSSDVYAAIEPGKRYRCDTYGWRLQFFSNYPNIVKCEPV